MEGCKVAGGAGGPGDQFEDELWLTVELAEGEAARARPRHLRRPRPVSIGSR